MSDKQNSPSSGTPSPIGEISQEPSAFEAFLDANQIKLLFIGILAVLLLVAYVIFDGIRTQNERDAAGIVSAARTIPELTTAAEDLAGTNAGGAALVLKAQLLWEQQQQDQAIEALEKAVADYPEHPATGNALATLGSYYQQISETKKAKEAFSKAVASNSSASSLALLALGDLALSEDQGEEAEEFYNRVISEYETHVQVKSMAQQRLKLVGVAMPIEATTPETPSEPTTPVVDTPALTPTISPANQLEETPAPATEEPAASE